MCIFLPSSSLSGVCSLILFRLFASGVIDTGGAPWLANISANVIIRGFGEGDSWKKQNTGSSDPGIRNLKGQCHEIFCFWFFSWISFPPAPEYSIKTVSNFSKIRWDIRSSRFATGVNDTGGKWKKSSIRKILIILFGHLWVVEKTCVYFCLQVHFQVSAAWYCSDYLPPVSLTPVVHLDLRISPRMLLSGALGKVIHEKNLKQKISWHCPFKADVTVIHLLGVSLMCFKMAQIYKKILKLCKLGQMKITI